MNTIFQIFQVKVTTDPLKNLCNKKHCCRKVFRGRNMKFDIEKLNSISNFEYPELSQSNRFFFLQNKFVLIFIVLPGWWNAEDAMILTKKVCNNVRQNLCAVMWSCLRLIPIEHCFQRAVERLAHACFIIRWRRVMVNTNERIELLANFCHEPINLSVALPSGFRLPFFNDTSESGHNLCPSFCFERDDEAETA